MIGPLRREPHATLLVIFFVLTLPLVTPILRGDGLGYYSYVASTVVDHDLDFSNEYAHIDAANRGAYLGDDGEPLPELRTRTGRVANKFAAGPAILWSPFFVVAHGLVKFRNALDPTGAPTSADSFSWPYLYLCALATALYGFLGLVLSYYLARRLLSSTTAFAAALGIWFASALPVYMYFLPFMSHAHSAFVVSVFIWYWWRTYRPVPADLTAATDPVPIRTQGEWTILGALAGFLFTTYYVNGLLWVFVAGDFIRLIRKASDTWPGHTRALLVRAGLPFGLGLALGLAPQAIVKTIIYGSPVVFEYGVEWFPASPRLVKVLFSSEHGVWSWTPVIFLSCAGLIPLTRRHPALGWRCVATVLAFYYTIASFHSWHGQSSFSNRFFVSLTPVFVLGLAALLDFAAVKLPAALPTSAARFPIPTRAALASVLVLLALWNWGFVLQWGTNLVPNRGPISWSRMVQNQFRVVPGRMLGVAGRLFRDRAALLEQIEGDDAREAKRYRMER